MEIISKSYLLSYAQDAKWIVTNIETIGIAIAKGILEYFGIKYKAPIKNQKCFIELWRAYE